MAGKQQTTREELEKLIMERCIAANMRIASVTVSPSKVYGWEANFFAAPAIVTNYLHDFDTIVRELRAIYDLKN